MEKNEVLAIQELVKKRYAECELNIQDFKGTIDTDLSYQENLKLIEPFLPKTKEMLRAEQQAIQEAEIKARLEKDLENITADSKELEKLYEYPIACIEMVCEGKSKGFLLHGETSLGKSYRVKEVLKRKNKKPMDKGIGDYMFVSGHITPMRFYAKMFECRDKIVIFDDVDILSNNIIINMIKAGLNENSGNVVEYHTTKKMDIPSSFVFNGQMIILLNKVPDTNEHLRAILSRVEHHELIFTREQKIKIIFEMAHKGTGSTMDGTTLQERIEIAKFLKENTSKATTNFNIRLFLQAINFFKWDKAKWKELTLGQITNDSYSLMIIDGINSEDFVEETGLSLATYKRLKKKLGMSRAYGVVSATGISNGSKAHEKQYVRAEI
jgi:hypothetical protein